MFKTLKGKISAFYLFLISIVAVLGTVSIVNFYSIEKTIDGLIATNYNSIERLSNMNLLLRGQNQNILEYIYVDGDKASIEFADAKNMFDYYREEEKGTIIKQNEMLIIESIREYYAQYCAAFDKLSQIHDDSNTFKSLEIFYNEIVPLTASLESQISELTNLNKISLFDRKYQAKLMAEKSTYMLIMLSVMSLIAALALYKYYTNRLFKPIQELTKTVRCIQSGDFGRKAEVESDDEIGMLANEFNNMTGRLREFEKSTLGSLMEEKNRSLAIMRNISEPIIIINSSMEVVLINKSFEKLFNLSESDVMGTDVAQIPIDSEIADFIISTNHVQDKAYHEKIISVDKDGEQMYYNVLITPICDKDGNVSSTIIIMHNVTGLKKLDKIRTDFIATISHEFKTPLTSIIMGTDLILDSNLGSLNDEQREIAETIKDDSSRLSNLVNEMLELCKIQSEKAVYDFESCNISQIVSTSMQQYDKLYKNSEVSLTYEPASGLPEVRADFEKITWVINNLLSNSIKYTPSGGRVVIKAWKSFNFIYVSVSDTGMGIPKELTGKLFDSYVKVREYDIEVRGSGLGLSISKDIITAHGGRIWCESEINEGSTFTFTVPLSK